MITLIIAAVLIATIYLYSTKNFDYWKKKGVAHDKPYPIIGNFGNVFFFKRSPTQLYDDLYKKYPNEKVVGYYRSIYPELLIRDPEIIKRVLVTDFNNFHMRQMFSEDISNEPLMRHLFNANGDLWRLLRQRLTPSFSSGKLKAMFPLIVERAERLHTRIRATAGEPIDARDLMARFTTDFIGACGFGLDMDALSDEDSEFRKLGKKVLNLGIKDFFKALLKQLSPKLFPNIKISERLESDMLSLVQSVLKQRNYKPSGRHDFVDILLECREKGAITGESMEKFNPDGTPEKVSIHITDDLIAAQMFVFFVAGFETSSATTSFTLHQLAYNPDKQRKVQEEIDRVLVKYDNKLCYDAVKDMHYLEMAFKEGMRMFPSVGYLFRDCVRTYKFPELDLTIDRDVRVIIPVQSTQTDPEYFDKPEQYRPERFSPEEVDTNKTKFAYLPFGDGPRGCIGERLGLMQSLAGLAAVLSKFTVEPAPTSVRKPIIDAKPPFIQTIQSGLPLLFRERKKDL